MKKLLISLATLLGILAFPASTFASTLYGTYIYNGSGSWSVNLTGDGTTFMNNIGGNHTLGFTDCNRTYYIDNAYYHDDVANGQPYTNNFTLNDPEQPNECMSLYSTYGGYRYDLQSQAHSFQLYDTGMVLYTSPQSYTISGTVYTDSNRDGVLDNGEQAYPNVTVTLSQNNQTVATTTSDSNGNYSFTSLSEGAYSVAVTPPSGYEATSTNPVTINDLTSDTTQNFGIDYAALQNYTISGTAFTDSDGDGVQDNGEQGYPNVTVTLSQNNQTVATTTSDSNGNYSFTSVTEGGPYSVAVTIPSGDLPSTTNPVTITYLTGNTTENFGIAPPILYGTFLYNGSGNWTVNLTGLGVTYFNHHDNGGNPSLGFDPCNGNASEDYSDSAFYHGFVPTPDGQTYTSNFTLYDPSQPNECLDLFSNAGGFYYQLQSSSHSFQMYNTGMVLYTPVSSYNVSGTVYTDSNHNGVQDNGEQGYANATVTVSQNNQTVATTTSGSDGSYSFPSLEAGTYSVDVTVPSGDIATTTNPATVDLTANTTENFGIAPATTTLTPSQTSYVLHNSQNSNQGAATYMELTYIGKGRALVQFSQSQIAAAIGNDSSYTATLELPIVSTNANWASGRQIDVDRLEQPWVQGNGSYIQNGNRGTGSGVTWNCSVDSNITNDSTNCSGSTAWDMLDQSSWPFDGTPTATATITNNETGTVSLNVTSDVQAYLNGTTNDGWIIRKDDETKEGDIELSSVNNSNKPQLVITDN